MAGEKAARIRTCSCLSAVLDGRAEREAFRFAVSARASALRIIRACSCLATMWLSWLCIVGPLELVVDTSKL